MLQSPWICVTISPNQKLPHRRGNFTEPLGGPQRQEGRIGSEPLRVLQRFGELTENCWRVTAQKAAGVVWYTEQGLFPDQKIRRNTRIFLLVDKF